MTSIVDKILAISAALDDERLPYAFGGALALAFCTERARGTIDIDVNVFVGPGEARRVLDALPGQIGHTDADLLALERDGQTRLRWEQTPVDLFLDTTEFHVEAAPRRRLHEFGGRQSRSWAARTSRSSRRSSTGRRTGRTWRRWWRSGRSTSTRRSACWSATSARMTTGWRG